MQYQTPSSRGAGGGYVMVNNTPLANAYYNTPHVTPSQPAGMAQIYQQHQQQPNSQSHYQPNVHHATQLNTQPIPAYPYNSQNTGGMNQGQIHQANTSNPYDLPPAYTSSNPSSRHGSMTVPTAGVDVSHSKSNSNSNSSSREHLNDDDFPTVTPTLARQTSTQRKVPIPDIPDTFPELENMTETQLEKLVNDEVARAAHIKTMHMVVSMEELKNDLKMSNLNDAKSIVDKVCVCIDRC